MSGKQAFHKSSRRAGYRKGTSVTDWGRRVAASSSELVGDTMALLLAATLASGLVFGTTPTVRTRASSACMGLHDLSATAMDGTDVKLDSLKGKKVIALNVASR